MHVDVELHIVIRYGVVRGWMKTCKEASRRATNEELAQPRGKRGDGGEGKACRQEGDRVRLALYLIAGRGSEEWRPWEG